VIFIVANFCYKDCAAFFGKNLDNNIFLLDPGSPPPHIKSGQGSFNETWIATSLNHGVAKVLGMKPNLCRI
jgi:hypothetical protein